MQVIIHVTGLDAVQTRLAKLSAGFKDFTAALTELGRQLIAFYGDTNFISQGQALGSTWTPLSEKTVAYKSSRWPGRGILQRTGVLQQSFTSDVTPDTLFITNAAPYFPYHQLGTATGPGRGHNIPARQMLGVNATVEAMIREVLETDIKAKIAGL